MQEKPLELKFCIFQATST